MIDRFLVTVQRGLAGVIGILVLFGLLVGLVVWAGTTRRRCRHSWPSSPKPPSRWSPGCAT